jgi:hypothetical protein
MRARSLAIVLLPLIAILLLAACGQQTAVAPTLAPPSPVPPVDTPSPVVANDLASLPHGQTAEGYQVLGAESAPVTLVMYSDFF